MAQNQRFCENKPLIKYNIISATTICHSQYRLYVSIRGWRTAHAHDEQKRANSGEFRQKQTNPNWPVFAHFLPIFGQKMGNKGLKMGERNRTLAKQGETESFAEF